jgi:exopolyphosphatase/guanosine-5'-triphosphate,3'-diphosphate pyrophosphatase
MTPIADKFTSIGWQHVVGSSGTMQALAEILKYRQQAISITLPFLYEIQQTLINCKNIDNITIDGLRADRAPVLASGLSILIALFLCFNIDELTLSSGALREGLLFELLHSTEK